MWLKEEDFRVVWEKSHKTISTGCERYHFGFHIFTSLKNAVRYRPFFDNKCPLYRVLYSEPTAIGMQNDNTETIVARRMYIIEKIDGRSRKVREAKRNRVMK